MTDSSPKIGKIFIGGLSYETTDEKLRSYFGAYGTVTDAVVMKDPISRRSRGFGFITYADPSCVDRALAQPNHVLDNRRVEAKRAVPRAESARDASSTTSSRGGPPSATSSSGGVSGSFSSSGGGGGGSSGAATKKIFVGGLHYETKDAEFKKYFSQYGKVVSAEVMFNRETNKSRGFGFVIFENEHSVDLVLQDGGHVLDGKSVEVKRAVPRTDAPPGAPSGPGATRAHLSSSTRGSFSDDLSSTPKHLLSPRSNPPISPASRSSPSLAPITSTGSSASASTFGGYAAAVRFGGGRIVSMPSSSHAPPGLDASFDQLHIDGAHPPQHPPHQLHRQSPDQSRLFRSHEGGSAQGYPPPYLSQHDYGHQQQQQWQPRHHQPQHWQPHQHQQGWSTEDHPSPGLRHQPPDQNRPSTVFGMFTPRQPPTAASSHPPPRWDSSYDPSGFQFGLGGFAAGGAAASGDAFEYAAPPPASSALSGLGIDGEDDIPLRFGDPSYLGIDQDIDDRPHPPSTNGTAPYLYRQHNRHEDDSSGGGYYAQYR